MINLKAQSAAKTLYDSLKDLEMLINLGLRVCVQLFALM